MLGYLLSDQDCQQKVKACHWMTYCHLLDLHLTPWLQAKAALTWEQMECCPGMLVFPEDAPPTDQNLQPQSITYTCAMPVISSNCWQLCDTTIWQVPQSASSKPVKLSVHSICLFVAQQPIQMTHHALSGDVPACPGVGCKLLTAPCRPSPSAGEADPNGAGESDTDTPAGLEV